MKGSDTVIDYLDRSIRHELTAVNQYWLHYRLQEDWGYGHLARKSREESIEEMQHADRLIARVIFLEGHPNLQQLDPLRIGQTVLETLECDLAAEYSARALYREAREVCRAEGDYVSMEMFETLLREEEDHIDFLETQIALHGEIGAANYGHLNATPADAAEA
jgi:bacterioferritin